MCLSVVHLYLTVYSLYMKEGVTRAVIEEDTMKERVVEGGGGV